MPTANDLAALRPTFRAFKRAASRLRDGHDALGEAKSINYNFSWQEGHQATSSFDEKAPLVRFAALLRPFMDDSTTEVRQVWSRIEAIPGLVDGDTAIGMAENFRRVDNLGIAVNLNGRFLSGRELYVAYADGLFFDERPEAKRLLEALSVGPFTSMLPFLFYTACGNYAALVYAVVRVILSIERNNPEVEPGLPYEKCIYCLTNEGDLSHEEHVIPEAFGLDEMVLTGCVCQKCNNRLGILDQHLANFELLSPLRVAYVPLTKSGKFPRADLRDVVVEKVKPRVIRYTSKSKRPVFTETRLPDGRVHLSMNVVSRKAVDMFHVARAMFKIALGIIAFDAGPAYACDARFDAARRFIAGKGTMPNHMIMPRQVTPSPKIATSWDLGRPTVVLVVIFGVAFLVNLKHGALAIPAEAPPDTMLAFWLGVETKKGIIAPCVSPCDHGSTSGDPGG